MTGGGAQCDFFKFTSEVTAPPAASGPSKKRR